MKRVIWHIILISICFSSTQAEIAPYFVSPHYSDILQYFSIASDDSFVFPMLQPYSSDDVHDLVQTTNEQSEQVFRLNWNEHLARELSNYYEPMTTDENNRLYLQARGRYDVHYEFGNLTHRYRLDAYGAIQMPHAVLVHQTAADRNYYYDDEYHGKKTEKLQGRVENAYLLAGTRNISFFAGRLYRNWGLMDEAGTLLSNNPYSYDQIGLSLRRRSFHYQFITAKLNDVMAVDDYDNIVYNEDANRYLTAQRVDYSFSNRLKLAISQSVVYGGVDKNPELAFLNPAGLFYLTQVNSLFAGNILYGFDVWWKPRKKLLWFNQILLDDLIVNNVPGQDDRKNRPDRLAWVSKACYADLIPGTLLNLGYRRVSNWTYQSYRNWENYTYFRKSLGYPANSHEKVSVGIDYLARPPYILKISYSYTRQGESDLEQTFGGTKESFPKGVVENGHEFMFNIRTVPVNAFYWDLGVSYESLNNFDHVIDQQKSGWTIILSLGCEWGKRF